MNRFFFSRRPVQPSPYLFTFYFLITIGCVPVHCHSSLSAASCNVVEIISSLGGLSILEAFFLLSPHGGTRMDGLDYARSVCRRVDGCWIRVQWRVGLVCAGVCVHTVYIGKHCGVWWMDGACGRGDEKRMERFGFQGGFLE